jgi:hypothetical protein
LGNAFYPAKLGDGFFTTQSIQHNADICLMQNTACALPGEYP